MTHWGVGARLLSCASVLALGGAFAGSAAAHSYSPGCKSITQPTTIDSDKKCVRVTKTVNGDVVNNATIGKTSGYGYGHGHGYAFGHRPGFFIGGGGLITGELVNNGWILGGSKGMGALTLGQGADVQGGIINNGTIVSLHGSGISLGYYEHPHYYGYGHEYGGPQAAALTGDIVNSGLIYGHDYGVAARHGTMSGALINEADGVIIGGDAGVYIADSFTSWSGGIKNSGLIYGGFAGIQIGEFGDGGWGGEYDGEVSLASSEETGGVVFSGGIFNYAGGAIVSKSGPSISIGGASFSGGVYNDGLITQYLGTGGESNAYVWGGEHSYASPYEGVGIVFAATTVEGGLINDVNGEIYGLKGPAVWITDKTQSFSGGIANLGTIAGAYDAIRIESAAFAGGLYNGASGAIVASEGDGVFASSAWTGNVENHGLISGAQNGFAFVGSTFDGDFGNAGLIEGGNVGVLMSGETFDGAFTNTGSINGGATGVALTFGSVTGGFTNSGSINGAWGNGVAIDVDSWGAADAHADIVNAAGGTITGAETGFLLDVGTMYGDFINDGYISGDGENTAVHITADALVGDFVNNEVIEAPYDAVVLDIDLFDGAFSNTGTITGGDSGAVLVLGQMTGDFTNSGSISGEWGNGVDTTVETWGSEAVPVTILNTADGVITGGQTGFALDAGTVHGALTNEGSITGGSVGVSIIADTFDAPFANSGAITGGVSGVVMVLGQASGGFTNSGSIAGEYGNAVDIVVTNWGAEGAAADIINQAGGTITGGGTGFLLDVGTMYGDFINNGQITGNGGDTGVHIVADHFVGDFVNNQGIDSPSDAVVLDIDTFDGSFLNTGNIAGGDSGAVLIVGQMTGAFTNTGSISGVWGNGVYIVATDWGSEGAPADIVNTATGTITGGDTGFLLDVGTMYGDFINDGQITGGGEETGVHIIADQFFGDFANNEGIDSPFDAVVLDINTFDGAFANTGDIDGGETGAVLLLGQMIGNFTNSGSISGLTGNGVNIAVDGWGSEAVPVAILNTAAGVITGGETGFALDAAALHGAIANEGSIAGGSVGASFAAETFDAAFANSGGITGGVNGVVMVLGQASGGFTNSGSIGGETGDGVDIVVTSWGTPEAPADIVNTAAGTITGGATGFALELVTLHGDITNAGAIEGGNIAVLVSGGTFDGAFENTGNIDGDATGVAFALSSVTGGFTNSGSISGGGGDGVAIDVDSWGLQGAPADIVNTATGAITGGDTGFLLDVGTMYGDFINDGQISGGGENTGVHIIAGTFVGDIVNNDQIDAPSNALDLDIGTLDGEVRNTGMIDATDADGVAVALNIGNGATFTNTGGGLLLGDAVFGGNAAYAFIAENGGIEGDLIGEGGEGNDDTITVQNGTHYFIAGTASNFASFTVADGGAAIMGALFEGDGAGTAYAFSNVDALNVNAGGTLYIDKSTTLIVGNSYVQQAGGTVEFYLGAPGGDGFSDLTGNVVAGPGDYGQVIVEGTVTLDGTVVGFLDPAFASANPGLNQVLYDDVIVAGGGISGDFSTLALIAESSLFELNQVIDGNTVDMIVARTSLTNIGSIPGIVVNTGGPFDAMVSDRSNGLGSGSCGLAGDGWCFNRFAANEPGATQVMTDASPGEDPFAWLRTGVRKVGETAAWGRIIGVIGETDGDVGSQGSEFDVVGAIVGVDHVFTPVFMAGVAAQWTTTDVDFIGRPDNAEIDSLEAGAYMSYGDTRLYLNANASVIWHSIDVFRFTPGGQALGDYDGTTFSVFAEAGKTFETEDFRIQPFLAMSYSHLETDAYSEAGTGTLLNVSESEFDSLKSMVGLRLAYPIDLDSGRKIVPEARLAWVHEFMDDQASFLATIQGNPGAPSLVRGERFSRDTAVAGAGVTVPLSDSASLFVDYDAGLNSDITTHTVSAGLRITW